MDLYPWVAFEADLISRKKVIARLFEKSVINTLLKAEAVVVIGRCMEERIAQLGIPRERIHLVRNWANTDLIRPVESSMNSFRQKHGLDEKFVLMYSGNLGISHYFDDLLEVATNLRDQDDIFFLFVGRGRRLNELKLEFERRNLPNFLFLDYQDYYGLGESLSAGDVHFVSLRKGFEGLVVPSKAYGIMAAGRPILYQGDDRGEIAMMINETGIGMVVPQGDVSRLQSSIQFMAENKSWCREKGALARKLSLDRFGFPKTLRVFEQLFDNLNKSTGPK
jgi:glycosyltransferase involved in cell wall biosynthesis